MNRRCAHALTLLAVVALGAWLRFHHLATVPGWYPDEGSNIAIAAALARGESAYLAFGQSSFINGHPHLFYLLLAGLFRLTGVDILGARGLSAGLGVLTLGLLYGVSRAMGTRRLALVAAAFYAVYPAAVVTSRMAFTYNLLAPLYLLTLYGLWRGVERGQRAWIALAALATGAAMITDLAAVGLLAFLLLALLLTRWQALRWALPLALLPLLAWGAAMTAWAGDAFLDDVAFTLSRTGHSFALQLAQVVFYRTTLEGDLWLAVGGAGLLWPVGPRPRWWTAGLFGLSLLVLTANTPAFGQASYFLIPLFPLAAWGVGTLVDRGAPVLAARLEEAWRSRLSGRRAGRLAAGLTALLLAALLVLPPLSMLAEGVWLGYGLYLARFGNTLADPSAAGRVLSYVNSRAAPDDVILASPTIAWRLQAHAADFQMAVAATGQDTRHFPAHLPPARFRFDPRLENATYAILDPLWRDWGAAQMPEVAQMIERIESDWLLEMTDGPFAVYRNPAR